MNTSLRWISNRAVLTLGLSGLAACDGEVTTEEDMQPVDEAGAGETRHEEQTPEREPAEPDVIVGEAPMVNVLSVTCLAPSDRDGMDEPMLVINGKQRWLGAGFVAGTTDQVRYESTAFEGVATIELWEVDVWDDYTDPNDLLGFLEVDVSALGAGPQIATIETRGDSTGETKGGKYEVVYQVEQCPGCSPGESPPVEP